MKYLLTKELLSAVPTLTLGTACWAEFRLIFMQIIFSIWDENNCDLFYFERFMNEFQHLING